MKVWESVMRVCNSLVVFSEWYYGSVGVSVNASVNTAQNTVMWTCCVEIYE